MSCQTKTYPFTAAEAVAIVAKIKAAKGPPIDPTKTAGEAVTHGVHLQWTIATDTITFSVADKPWIIPCNQIFGQLDELFSEQ